MSKGSCDVHREGTKTTKLARVIVRRDPEEESDNSNSGIEKLYEVKE